MLTTLLLFLNGTYLQIVCGLTDHGQYLSLGVVSQKVVPEDCVRVLTLSLKLLCPKLLSGKRLKGIEMAVANLPTYLSTDLDSSLQQLGNQAPIHI